MGAIEDFLQNEFGDMHVDIGKKVRFQVYHQGTELADCDSNGRYIQTTFKGNMPQAHNVLYSLVAQGIFGQNPEMQLIIPDNSTAIMVAVELAADRDKICSYGEQGSHFWGGRMVVPTSTQIPLTDITQMGKLAVKGLAQDIARVYVLSGKDWGDSESKAELNIAGEHGIILNIPPKSRDHYKLIRAGRSLDQALQNLLIP